MKTTFLRQTLVAIFVLTPIALQAQPALNSTFKDAQGITYVVTKVTAPYKAKVQGGIGNPNRFVSVTDPVIPATVSNGSYDFDVAGIQATAFDSNQNLTGVLAIHSSGSIGNGAFGNCRNLTGHLSIPATATDIGSIAFIDCYGLTGLTLNNKGYIGRAAFSGCSGLTGALAIPSGITIIDEAAFAGCSGLTSVDFSDYIGINIGAHIRSYAFAECSSINKLTFGATYPKTNRDAFKGVAEAGTFHYPADVIAYEYLLFKAPEYSILPAGWTPIFTGAPAVDATFTDAQGITYIITNLSPYEVRVHGGESIQNNRRAKVNNPTIPATVTIGNNEYAVVGIEDRAFYNNQNLTGQLTVQCSGNIGDGAFSGCYGLTGSLTVHSSVTNINESAFFFCINLSGLTLNNSGKVGNGAFAHCYRLNSIDFSAYTGDSINNVSFWSCSSLRSITFGSATAPTVGKEAFNDMTDFGTLYCPEGATGYDTILKYLPAGWNTSATTAKATY
jgi:hypothetical protein